MHMSRGEYPNWLVASRWHALSNSFLSGPIGPFMQRPGKDARRPVDPLSLFASHMRSDAESDSVVCVRNCASTTVCEKGDVSQPGRLQGPLEHVRRIMVPHGI